MNTRSEIVVTGTSAISAAGIGISSLMLAVESGRSFLRPVPGAIGPGAHLWGKAEDFKASDFMPPIKARRFDRGSLFAVAAAGMALKDADIVPGAGSREGVGIALGCGFGGIANSEELLRGWFTRKGEGLVPMLFPNTVPNAPASNASIEHGLKGPNVTLVQRFCSAEAAFQMACRFLEEGRADVMLAGGVDEIHEIILKGFISAGQMRGWGRSFGEGCGMMVLERREDALKRGARILGTVGGVRTVGRLLPGREAEGASRLFGAAIRDVVSFSGSAAHTPVLCDRFGEISHIEIAPLVGRSLAMGGLALAALINRLKPGQVGLHIAASPEGPYFAIDILGGAPAQP